MDFGSIIGTIFSGGVTGIIGTITNAIASYKMKQLEFDHQEKMEDYAIQQTELETKREVKIAEIQTEQIDLTTSAEIQKESYKKDKATYVSSFDFSKLGKFGQIVGGIIGFFMGVVDFARGIIRPGSTIYFEVFMFLIWTKLFTMTQGFENLPQEKIVDLFYMVTLLILYCATTCITWWFGARHMDKIFAKKLGG